MRWVIVAALGVGLACGVSAEPGGGQAASRALLLAVEKTDGALVAVGEHGVILRSADDAGSWAPVASGTLKTLTDITIAPDGRGLWAVGHDELILHSADAGQTWQVQNVAPEHDNPLLNVLFTDERNGVAVGGYGVMYRTSDAGAHWQRQVIHGEDGQEYNLYGIARAASGAWFLAGEQGRLLRSTDGGESWQPLESPYAGSFFGIAALADGGLVAYGMLGNVWRSDDDGLSWQQVTVPVEQSLLGHYLAADGRLFLVGRAGIALRSTDGGRSFEPIGAPARRVNAGVVPLGEKVVLVGSGGVGVLP